MKRGLAALDRKAAKQRELDYKRRIVTSEQRKTPDNSGTAAVGHSLSSQRGQLPKALALQLQLCTDGTAGSVKLDSILRQIIKTSSSTSSQHEAVIRGKLVDKTVSLLPSRRANNTSTKTQPIPARRRKVKAPRESSWVQDLKNTIVKDPSKASSINEILTAAWQAYVSNIAQKLCAGNAVDLLRNISLIGAPITVSASRDPQAVGMQGTCLWDSSRNVHVLVMNHPSGVAKCKTLCKQSTVFSIGLPDKIASQVGERSVQHVGVLCVRT